MVSVTSKNWKSIIVFLFYLNAHINIITLLLTIV